MISSKIPNIGRLHCLVDHQKNKLFFSLVDYRNNYFTSDDPNKIIEFYNGFEDRDQLILWMKERPKGVATLHEVEGDKEIIVVIPTADFSGEYARDCRGNIFKGLHIVFVESGGIEDFYFNYAHNCNVGIKKAMEYNPKWIVFSNDDMYKIDDIAKLKSGLTKFSSEEQSVVLCCKESLYHSKYISFSFRTARRKAIFFVMGEIYRKRLLLEKKFKIKYIIGMTTEIFRFFYRPRFKFKYTGSFGIFSIGLVKKYGGVMFDETYVNGTEDLDQSWRFIQDNIAEKCLNYEIGDYIGSSLGPYTIKRILRILLNDVYLNLKIESGELKLSLFS